jgi:hypothetical protein
MAGPGTGLTLAVFPHRWGERTFIQARGTTELDPIPTFEPTALACDGARSWTMLSP